MSTKTLGNRLYRIPFKYSSNKVPTQTIRPTKKATRPTKGTRLTMVTRPIRATRPTRLPRRAFTLKPTKIQTIRTGKHLYNKAVKYEIRNTYKPTK